MPAEHDVTPIWDQIMAAVRDVGPRPPTLERHLVNGRLLLTHDQYMEIWRAESDKPLFDLFAPNPTFEPKPVDPAAIEVIVVTPKPVEIGDKIAFLLNDTIYVANKADLNPPISVPAGGIGIL